MEGNGGLLEAVRPERGRVPSGAGIATTGTRTARRFSCLSGLRGPRVLRVEKGPRDPHGPGQAGATVAVGLPLFRLSAKPLKPLIFLDAAVADQALR